MVIPGPGADLEQVTIFTVLGIQFWDPVLDQQVTNSLVVSAQLLTNTDYMPTTAFRTSSGVYAFQGLPCLHDVENPGSRAAPTSSPVQRFPFGISVSDTANRFLPALFVVELPLPYLGLFLSDQVTSPPGSGARAYLFPAATRPLTAGVSEVSADLWDHDTGQPAAYAALEVSIEGQVWRGIADDQGRAVVQFPSPLVTRLSLGSPPGSGQGPTTGMSWPIQIALRYQPSKLRFPLANSRGAVWPWPTTPSLKSILDEQQYGLIWQQETGPPAVQWTGNLVYGEDLILRTVAGSPSAGSSVLMVSAATSSP
jgi:hypothetical protein